MVAPDSIKKKFLEAPKSAYDLGTSEGVMKLVKALGRQGRQTGRPLVDGGLSWLAKQQLQKEPEQPQVEPEESEET